MAFPRKPSELCKNLPPTERASQLYTDWVRALAIDLADKDDAAYEREYRARMCHEKGSDLR
jgi:hypothetical protein